MIQVEGLTKYYGEHAAIRDLSFSIQRGEVIGFLGLNGAGKSTTLSVLGCVLLPTSGRVQIDGLELDQEPHEIRKRIGFLPESPPLYVEMTVGRYLEFAARLRGVPASDVPGRVHEAEERTALTHTHDEIIGTLSHGYRQRVGLAQALVHRPALLILDEPTKGLDPVQIVEMRQLIRGLRGAHTILLSSHILHEISQTCDRMLVIHQGEIIGQGSEAELAQKMGAGGVEVDVGTDAQIALAAVRVVPGVKNAVLAKQAGSVATLRVDAPAELRPQIARALVGSGADVLRIDRGSGQLESIFLQLTQGKDLPS